MPRKDERRAWLISLVLPGAGQIYCGKKARGYWTLGFFLLAFLVVVLLPAQTPLWGAALRAALVLYGYTFLDGYFTAREINQSADPPPYQNPRAAAVLNLLTRGFGYFYLGQRKKGLLVFLGLALAEGVLATLRTRGGPATWAVVGLELLFVAIAIDAYRIAARSLRAGRGDLAATEESGVIRLGLDQRELPAAAPTPVDAAGGVPYVPRLAARVPLGLAAILSMAYAGLTALGLAMPDYSVIDQSRASLVPSADAWLYSNARYGLEMQLPAGWSVKPGHSSTFLEAAVPNGACHLKFLAEPTLPFFGLEPSVRALTESLRQQDPTLRLTGEKYSKLGPLAAHEVAFSARLGSVELVQYYVLARRGSTLYALVATAPEQFAEACHAAADFVRQRIRIGGQ